MKIAYITHTRFPTEKAHGKQIAEVCSALADIGHDVTLVCPRVRNNILASPHDYYNLPENFEVRYLHHFDGTAQWWIPGILRFMVTMFFYRRALKTFLADHASDLLYVRSVQLVTVLPKLQVPVIAELHTIPQRNLKKIVKALNACTRVVCLTNPMKEAVVALGVEPEKIVVEGDGVLLDRFTAIEPVESVRKQLQVPKDRAMLSYVGSLVTRNTIEKGVAELLQALTALKANNIAATGVIVGGPTNWKVKYIQQARNLGLTDDDVVFIDRVPPKDVPSILAASDVLVFPAPASDHPYFQRDTSPLKLFEYLAAGKPIVCADIPPVRDVVHEDSVIFVEPGNADALAQGIQQALQENDEQRTLKRRELAEWYSWRNRMQRILDGV